MHHRMVGAQRQRPQVRRYCSVEDPSLFQDISQVDQCIDEVRIQGDGLLEVVYGQPYLALGVEDAPKVGPRYGEVGLRLNRF